MARIKDRPATTGVLITLIWFLTAVNGCAVSGLSLDGRIIPVASLSSIAGEWEGMSKSVPRMLDDAYVMLVIREEGRFNFISNRRKETLLGTGSLTIDDGAVVAKGNHGHALLTLHKKVEGPVLVVQAALASGHHYYIEMTPRK